MKGPVSMEPQAERLLRLMVIWEKPVQSYPLEEFGTQEPKSVRLIDAQIAAEAAGAAILVAEDKGLIDRCELLRTRGCIQFQSMGLSEFLGKKRLSLS